MQLEEEQLLRGEFHKNRMIINIVGVLALGVLLIGTLFYARVEGLKVLDAAYFSTMTLTTIGYGDITPKTDLGKLFTMAYAIVGIGIIGAFANYFLRNTVIRRQLNAANKRSKPDGTE